MKKYLIIILIIASLKSFATNTIWIDTNTVFSGDTAFFEVFVENQDNFVSFQFDIKISPELNYLNNSANLTARSANHILLATVLNDSTLRFISYSPINSNFSGNDGSILNFQLIASVVEGDFDLIMDNVVLGNSSSQNIIDYIYNGKLIVQSYITAKLFNEIQELQVKVFPNPVSAESKLNIYLQNYSMVYLSVFKSDGSLLLNKMTYLSAGHSEYFLSDILDFRTLPKGNFIFQAIVKKSDKKIVKKSILLTN